MKDYFLKDKMCEINRELVFLISEAHHAKIGLKISVIVIPKKQIFLITFGQNMLQLSFC